MTTIRERTQAIAADHWKARETMSEKVVVAQESLILAQIEQQLETIHATTRFLLAMKLVEQGHARNLREASKIAKDPARLAAIYPEPRL